MTHTFKTCSHQNSRQKWMKNDKQLEMNLENEDGGGAIYVKTMNVF
jgi:hypothetical protein